MNEEQRKEAEKVARKFINYVMISDDAGDHAELELHHMEIASFAIKLRDEALLKMADAIRCAYHYGLEPKSADAGRYLSEAVDMAQDIIVGDNDL